MYSLIVLREADVDAIRDPTSSSTSSNSTQLYEVHDYENPDPNFHAVDPQIWKEKMIKFIGELFDDFRLPCSREKFKQITICNIILAEILGSNFLVLRMRMRSILQIGNKSRCRID